MATWSNLKGNSVKYGTINISSNTTTSPPYGYQCVLDLTQIEGYENIVYIGVVGLKGNFGTDSTTHSSSIAISHVKGSASATIEYAPCSRFNNLSWSATLLYVIDPNA